MLHYDEGLTVAGTDFVNCADVRMVQLRGMLCFATQLRLSFDIVFYSDLERHVAAELDVSRCINLPHTAGADEPAYKVTANGSAGQQRTRRAIRRRQVLWLDERGGLSVRTEQSIDLGSELSVACTLLGHKRRAIFRRAGKRLIEQPLYADPLLWSHAAFAKVRGSLRSADVSIRTPVRGSKRPLQFLVQERFTVALVYQA